MKAKLLVPVAGFVLMLVSSDLAALSASATVPSAMTGEKTPGNMENVKEETKSVYLLVESIVAKLREKRFAEVQAYFNRLLVEKPYTNSGSRMLDAIYDEISNTRNILDALQAWCNSKTAGHSAFILRGKYHIADAWRARGGGWAYTVTEEGRRLMKERLLLAKEDLEKAFSMNPQDPNSAASMIVVCMGLPLDQDTMEAWFQKAVNADNCAFHPYLNKFTYLQPKWHGSLEELGRFAHSCYTNRPPCGRAFTVIMEFLFERARDAGDKKAFWLDPAVKRLTDELMQQWLKEFPNSTAARVHKAYMAEDIGKEQEAISYCNEALKIDPYEMSALSKRGDVHFNTQSYSAAEDDYNQLLKFAPSNDYGLACLGKIYLYHHKNYEQAIALFDKAIKENDKTGWYSSNEARPILC